MERNYTSFYNKSARQIVRTIVRNKPFMVLVALLAANSHIL